MIATSTVCVKYLTFLQVASSIQQRMDESGMSQKINDTVKYVGTKGIEVGSKVVEKTKEGYHQAKENPKVQEYGEKAKLGLIGIGNKFLDVSVSVFKCVSCWVVSLLVSHNPIHLHQWPPTHPCKNLNRCSISLNILVI